VFIFSNRQSPSPRTSSLSLREKGRARNVAVFSFGPKRRKEDPSRRERQDLSSVTTTLSVRRGERKGKGRKSSLSPLTQRKGNRPEAGGGPASFTWCTRKRGKEKKRGEQGRNHGRNTLSSCFQLMSEEEGEWEFAKRKGAAHARAPGIHLALASPGRKGGKKGKKKKVDFVELFPHLNEVRQVGKRDYPFISFTSEGGKGRGPGGGPPSCSSA